MQTANLVQYIENSKKLLDEKIKVVKDYSEKIEENFRKTQENLKQIKAYSNLIDENVKKFKEYYDKMAKFQKSNDGTDNGNGSKNIKEKEPENYLGRKRWNDDSEKKS